MCRNALVFLNEKNYYQKPKEAFVKKNVCDSSKLHIFDSFHADAMNIDFCSHEEIEKQIKKNFFANYQEFFTFDWAVVGLSYQTGRYLKPWREARFTKAETEKLRFDREQKYLKRCKLNTGEGNLSGIDVRDTENKKVKKFIEWYENHSKLKYNLREETIKYCIRDVELLREGCIKYMMLIIELADMEKMLKQH